MSIKKILAIASAKGGVGKSSIAALSALILNKDHDIGILDADIYGPNQHILFKVNDLKLKTISKKNKNYFKPLIVNNIKISSMGSIIESSKAALWRGPMLSSSIKQLMHSTDWGDLDLLIIDMPPGTGDAYLTACKEVEIDAAILVTTPNYLSIKDTIKSIDLFTKFKIPIIGYIENQVSNYDDNNNYEFDPNIPKISTIPFDESIYNMEFNNLNKFNDLKKFLDDFIGNE